MECVVFLWNVSSYYGMCPLRRVYIPIQCVYIPIQCVPLVCIPIQCVYIPIQCVLLVCIPIQCVLVLKPESVVHAYMAALMAAVCGVYKDRDITVVISYVLKHAAHRLVDGSVMSLLAVPPCRHPF